MIEITPEYLASQGFSETFPKRFWSKVQKTDSCWIWLGSLDYATYGWIGKGSRKSGIMKAHRASWILTTDPGTGKSAPGEYIVLAFPFVDTTNTFSTISGIMKDETFGPLNFYQVDPSTLVETTLSSMEPNEGTALYRKYMINGIPSTNLCCQGVGTVQLSAKARLDFIPVENETDYLTLPNIPAILEESQSLRYSRMDSPAASQQSLVHHGKAIALLNGMLDLYEGKVRTSVNVPLFGSNRLVRQPV